MPTEGHAFMFGGTKKRSTLTEEKVIYFPRDDAASPRIVILNKYCPVQFKTFRHCLDTNGGDENKCPTEKRKLTKCANKAFYKVNSDTTYVF